ncbi:MAG: hypothetical protein GX557_13335 [Chloroflexi bacterium]|nr:hypothetical protein [Chloroflexota bacterium]
MTAYREVPARCVLEGVPRIHFYEGGPGCPEDICFPSALKAVMQYLGDPIGCKHTDPPTRRLAACGYAWLVGVTGEAFALSWAKDWQYTSAIHEFADEQNYGPYRQALDALGYDCYIDQACAGTSAAIGGIRASIVDRHRPAIGFGVVGPPEAAIITGYDEHGAVLIGWSFFQKEPQFTVGLEYEPCGYFRAREWTGRTEAVLTIGEKRAEPRQEQVVLRALRWNSEVARRKQVRGAANGLAAYNAWASALADEARFADLDEATLRRCHQRHDMNVGAVAESRWYGAQFLIEAAEHVHYSMVEDLFAAAARLAGEHDLMWKAWDACGGNGNPEAWRYLADPAVRRQLVQLIRASRAKDADAVSHLEHALALQQLLP